MAPESTQVVEYGHLSAIKAVSSLYKLSEMAIMKRYANISISARMRLSDRLFLALKPLEYTFVCTHIKEKAFKVNVKKQQIQIQ